MLTTTKISKKFGVTKTTILRWSNEFHLHLSASANPPKGQPRKFNSDDVELLGKIQKLYADKKSTSEIKELLGFVSEVGDSAENSLNSSLSLHHPSEMVTLAQYRTIEGDLQTAQAVAQTIAKERDKLAEKMEQMQDRLIESEAKRGELTGQINAIKEIQATQRVSNDRFLQVLIFVIVVILCIALYFGLRGI